MLTPKHCDRTELRAHHERTCPVSARPVRASRETNPGHVPADAPVFDAAKDGTPSRDDFFFFDPAYRHLIGATRHGARGVVVNLDVRREIAELPLPGMPHLGSGVTWERGGERVMATPHLGEAKLSAIAPDGWRKIAEIETGGPGFFLRTHEKSPYL